ncbi:MAG: hypothetical protein C5B53_07065 [Candidatus Melainabacteria bacterium]|nr:MAG: hypothetical protein C5B53_07065 [Candidatus Melainabacteria bacterium]
MFRNILYKAFSLKGSREVAAFNRDSGNCAATQSQRLLQIVSKNADTEYGKKHDFASIKCVSDFQKAVPVCDYDTLSERIERIANGEKNILTSEQPFMFATTSGTTGSRKLIPVTASYLTEFRKASVTSGYHMLKHFPGVAQGVALSIFSPAEEGRTAGNLPYGAISGRLYHSEPALIRRHISPLPYEIFLIKDYETRYYTLLRCALVLPIACIYTLNPSTIALLGRRLKLYGERLIDDIKRGVISPPGLMPDAAHAAIGRFLRKDLARAKFLQDLWEKDQFVADKVWPSLSLISCWTKAAASFYLQDFPDLFGDVPVCDITYGASEGRGTVFLSPERQALAIRSHFFEFIETEKMEKGSHETLTASQLEMGKEYYILFTTSAGLYRYHINDIVRVSDWFNDTPCLEFLHKGGNVSSFTGEKLTESQVTEAASQCARLENLSLRFFTVIPEFRPEPHYQLWFESQKMLNEAQLFQLAERFDQCLSESNSEYEVKRSSMRLAAPKAFQLAANTYENLRKQMVANGMPDAQIKISHLNPKPEIKALLKERITAIPLPA